MSTESSSNPRFIPAASSDENPTTDRFRYPYRTCALCELPIGESEFSVGLKSGRSLHLDCYLSVYKDNTGRPAA